MLWQALADLALAHGRRLSWRDLARHTAQVDDHVAPEVAAITLRAHGVPALVMRSVDLAATLSSVLLPVALRLKDGAWALVTATDGQHACVHQVCGEHHLASGGVASSVLAIAQVPASTAGSDGQQRWPLAQLQQMHDGLLIAVDPSAQASPPAASAEEPSDQAAAAQPQGEWFWSVMRHLRAHYGDCAVAAVLVNVLGLASSMFSMNVYDRVIPNAAMHSLWTLAIGVLLACVVELCLRSLRAHVLDDAGKRADLALSASLLRQTMNLRPADRPSSSGQWASQLREFESVRDFVSSTTLVALTDLPFSLVFLLVIAWMGGHLVWIPLVAGVLMVVLGALTQWPIRRSVAQYQYETTQKHAFMIETLERLETIEALGAEPVVQGRWERLCAAAARSAMVTRMASAFTVNAAQFLQQVANVVLIVAGVYLILAGQLTVGALIGCSILASRALSPLSQVAGLMARWQHTRQAFQTVDRLMHLPLRQDPQQTYVAWPAAPDLSLQGVRFRYPRSSHDVLRIERLELRAGQTVALTGPVGSGKSTLLRVLAGLQAPTEGRLMAAGLAADQISPSEWRAHVAWVGQDCVLFRGTLRENLLLAAPRVSDERLIHVLRLCGLDRLAADHPLGLDMPLGEAGQALSGGQRQWVALARALLADAQVLLLDEPTSAMDMGGEQQLLERLRPELQGKLVVIATHRPGPLVLADRMVVLDAGQVVADGPRDAVLQALGDGRVSRAPRQAEQEARA